MSDSPKWTVMGPKDWVPTPGPKGDPGANGTDGAQGIQGVAGPKGDKGDTGSPGTNGTNGTNGVSPLLSSVFPVGFVYTSTVSTNPNTLFGFGTWTALGAGQVLVAIDTNQTEFASAGQTGGAKTVTLDATMIPAHNHGITDPGHNHTQNAHSHTEQLQGGTTGATAGTNVMGSTATGGSLRSAAQSSLSATATNNSTTTGISTTNTGGGGSHSNLQPYRVVYRWERTA